MSEYKRPLFQALAQFVESAKTDLKYEYALEALMKHMPSGSGIDSGTKLLLNESSQEKLVFFVEYHHMSQNGYYCGWSSRKITITPSLLTEFNLDISDEDYSGVDCIDSSEEHLNEECEDENCVNDEHYQYDNEEFITDSTGDYLADTFHFILKEPVVIDMSIFEPTKLSWHGELVKNS